MTRFTTPEQAWNELFGQNMNPDMLLTLYAAANKMRDETWLLEDAVLWHIRAMDNFNIDEPEWLRARQHPDRDVIVALVSLYIRDRLSKTWSYRFAA